MGQDRLGAGGVLAWSGRLDDSALVAPLALWRSGSWCAGCSEAAIGCTCWQNRDRMLRHAVAGAAWVDLWDRARPD
ncbi:hypothetical protein NDU88_005322 [Pleurodeles waltl]|uniref:Uncharacterized protein n=1 Tax=Pleurodeles waltl TaxID=8319 RepID=A0AAV7PFC5_PLEWA|nr:hypothetical protein NDU88_005322 [Pleurodeles waltl]